MRSKALILFLIATASCGRLEDGAARPLSAGPTATSSARWRGRPCRLGAARKGSLWSRERGSPGDRRAVQRGDILTVVIEIDDRAEISNSTGRSCAGSDSMGIPSLFGVPEAADKIFPMAQACGGGFDKLALQLPGRRVGRTQGKLTPSIAATVVEVMTNGVLRIEGSQEVRVNFELRELVVRGFVRLRTSRART